MDVLKEYLDTKMKRSDFLKNVGKAVIALVGISVLGRDVKSLDALTRGERATNTAQKTSDYTLTAADDFISGNPTTSLTLTLPTAVGAAGKIYTVQNVSTTGVLIIAAAKNQTVGGEATYTIRTADSGVTVILDNANWRINGVF
jgi:hypothetical protein